MEIYNLRDFKNGWYVGDFEPSIYKSGEFEASVKFFLPGQSEPSHKQKIATEITVVISGCIKINNTIFRSGEIIVITAGEFADFFCIEESALAVIKFPSLPSDKVLR
jgi:hypothetical protein